MATTSAAAAAAVWSQKIGPDAQRAVQRSREEEDWDSLCWRYDHAIRQAEALGEPRQHLLDLLYARCVAFAKKHREFADKVPPKYVQE
jgi:uncharacterized protein YeaO (DUF488 family)